METPDLKTVLPCTCGLFLLFFRFAFKHIVLCSNLYAVCCPFVHMLYRYHFVLGNAEAFPQQVYRYNNIFCDLIDNNSQRRTYI